MLCPYCGEETESGYLVAQNKIIWSREHKDPAGLSFGVKASDVLVSDCDANYSHPADAEAELCRNCGVVITPVYKRRVVVPAPAGFREKGAKTAFCPCCGEEMEAGYLLAGQKIMWTQNLKSFNEPRRWIRTGSGDVMVSEPGHNIFKLAQADATLCRNCLMVVAPASKTC